jgi:dUTP pyrophosphatase
MTEERRPDATSLPDLRVKRLHEDAVVPCYAHQGDAGMDLVSVEDVTLAPLERASVGTGLALAIPEGFAGFVQPRSGLALRKGLGLVNSPGLIDSHYRGELRVILINLDPHSELVVRKGERMAQLVIQPVARLQTVETDDLDSTVRGEGGFGSTGV